MGVAFLLSVVVPGETNKLAGQTGHLVIFGDVEKEELSRAFPDSLGLHRPVDLVENAEFDLVGSGRVARTTYQINTIE